MIFAAIRDGDLLARRERARRRRLAAPDADRERQSIKAELDAYAEDAGAGRITRDEWMTARAGLARRLAAAEATLAEADAAPDPVARLITDDLEARWPTLDVDRQRAVIGAVFERLTVRPATRKGPAPMIEGIGRIDPDRIDPTWRA